MSKAFSIAVALVVAASAIGAAQAQNPIDLAVAQQDAKDVRGDRADEKAGIAGPTSGTPRGAVQSIIAQERGRHSDARVFGPSAPSIQFVGTSDGFDFRDAGVGGAATLALALLAAGAVALRNGSRPRPAS